MDTGDKPVLPANMEEITMEIDLLTQDILRQPQVFRSHRQRLLDIPGLTARSVPRAASVIFTGIATSLSAICGNLCLMAEQGLPSGDMVNTSDLLDYWYPQERDARPLVVVSRSGESAEILRLLDTIRSDRTVIGITEAPESPLGRRSSLLFGFHAEEQAFPNTLSFTLSQLYLLAVCCGLGYEPSKPLEELLEELCQAYETVFHMTDSGIGRMAAGAGGVLIEGQGPLTGVVTQYALDFHETRVLGIPVTGGIMRHGVMELTMRDDIFTLLLIPHDRNAGRKYELALELWNTHHNSAIVTNSPACQDGPIPTLRLPKVSRDLDALLFTAGMQLIYLSYVKEKGLDRLSPALIGKVTRKE